MAYARTYNKAGKIAFLNLCSCNNARY